MSQSLVAAVVKHGDDRDWRILGEGYILLSTRKEWSLRDKFNFSHTQWPQKLSRNPFKYSFELHLAPAPEKSCNQNDDVMHNWIEQGYVPTNERETNNLENVEDLEGDHSNHTQSKNQSRASRHSTATSMPSPMSAISEAEVTTATSKNTASINNNVSFEQRRIQSPSDLSAASSSVLRQQASVNTNDDIIGSNRVVVLGVEGEKMLPRRNLFNDARYENGTKENDHDTIHTWGKGLTESSISSMKPNLLCPSPSSSACPPNEIGDAALFLSVHEDEHQAFGSEDIFNPASTKRPTPTSQLLTMPRNSGACSPSPTQDRNREGIYYSASSSSTISANQLISTSVTFHESSKRQISPSSPSTNEIQFVNEPGLESNMQMYPKDEGKGSERIEMSSLDNADHVEITGVEELNFCGAKRLKPPELMEKREDQLGMIDELGSKEGVSGSMFG
ncbi:hypothetical protein BC938DRAFT_470532 [Jimgerdemannia flammicorona]|uniref:Uncharacterized protein n=1 Tax=Jimgerdemannia flammicorona TaxID=994334 RepID=A0A433Q9Z0_9FUNG|nr:hypothetical protein BC938DRAFT_470532 [Jimgerdemannia flammicorona]